MEKIKTPKIDCTVPGQPMTQDEMQLMIKEAENGKFHSMQVLMEKVSAWKAKQI